MDDDLTPLGTLLRAQRSARTQTLMADLALSAIVCIVVLASVIALTLAAEHTATSVVPLACLCFIVFYLVGSSDWQFNEVGGLLRDHQMLFSVVSYWLLWEFLVCMPSIWDEGTADWQVLLKHSQNLLKLLLFLVCIAPVPDKVLITLLLCVLPFVRNDGLSTDELLQTLQCAVFLFNYIVEFMISKHNPSVSSSALQAVWCLVLVKPLPLILGTVIRLSLRTVVLLIAQKSHTQ